jgi:hypothetical protein
MRQLICDSSGWFRPGSILFDRLTIQGHLPYGRCLIRRVSVQSVPKTGKARKRSNPGRINCPVHEKYRVIIPQSVRHALQLDAEDGTTFWADAIKKEIASLLALDCFEFHSPNCKPSSEYQWTKLSMIFEVKQNGRRKGRLVASGHMGDPMGINSRSTVMKGISVRLSDIIAHRDNLPILCGDIGNTFIMADCLDFGDWEGSVLVFKKALYGLRSCVPWDSQPRVTIVMSGCGGEKTRTAMTPFALTLTISKSWRGTLSDGRHRLLARFSLSRLDPRPTA